MSSVVATLARLAATLVVAGAYLMALTDWGRFSNEEKKSGRRAAWTWGLTALGLVLLIGILRGVAFGWARCWQFLMGDGRWLVLQSLGLIILIQVGQAWAGQGSATAFPRRFRSWRRWPWLILSGALAAMLAWTLLIAWIVPHQNASTDLLRRFGLEGMDPWLQIPTAIALLTLAPIIEEALFRHYLLYRVAVWLSQGQGPTRPWMPNAIFITSLLWSIGHLGQIEPFWVKWMQVFVPGLILGWIAWQHGLERAIALHWAFNLCLLLLLLD